MQAHEVGEGLCESERGGEAAVDKGRVRFIGLERQVEARRRAAQEEHEGCMWHAGRRLRRATGRWGRRCGECKGDLGQGGFQKLVKLGAGAERPLVEEQVLAFTAAVAGWRDGHKAFEREARVHVS